VHNVKTNRARLQSVRNFQKKNNDKINKKTNTTLEGRNEWFVGIQGAPGDRWSCVRKQPFFLLRKNETVRGKTRPLLLQCAI
jgi:hypothetical protein